VSARIQYPWGIFGLVVCNAIVPELIRAWIIAAVVAWLLAVGVARLRLLPQPSFAVPRDPRQACVYTTILVLLVALWM
jgi:hypothetical protein